MEYILIYNPYDATALRIYVSTGRKERSKPAVEVAVGKVMVKVLFRFKVHLMWAYLFYNFEL